jgi:hypothetical protein
MNLAVDHARQDVQAAAIDAFARRRCAERADRDDPFADDPDVARADAVLIDDDSAFEDQIETIGHCQSSAVIASEAKQSIRDRRMDCFASLAMTAKSNEARA